MKVLVTGGAGYIGSHTVRQLVKAGADVTVLDNLSYGHKAAIVDKEVKFVQGDLGDATVVYPLLMGAGFDAVIHFAAFIEVGESVTNPLKYYTNNIAKPLILLGAMKAAGVRAFVFSSTCATYGVPTQMPIPETEKQDPINPYGASKFMLERVCKDCDRAWGLKSVFLRYFNASGASLDSQIGEAHNPETHLIPIILQTLTGQRESITVFGTDYDTPDGTCIRDYIHVDDLADAHLRSVDYLLKGGETNWFNLGTGLGLSVKEIIDTAERVTGKKVPVVYGNRREGDPARLIAVPTKAKEILGWEAKCKDASQIVETAWKWVTGPRKGKFNA
ncbi:MAG: UDP-glucose 4-epimerase GalE [Akkermansia sp.]